MNLSLRPPGEAELPLLAQMNKRLIEDEGSRNPMSVAQLQERMRGWLEGAWTVRLFVDAEQAEMVGYAVYQERPDEYAPTHAIVYLRQFYVERHLRSRGIGLAALALLREEFPPDCTVVIDVLATNPRGQDFWSRMGFEPYCTTMHLAKPSV